MGFIDDAKTSATMAIPGPGTPEEHQKKLDAMSVAELSALWCAQQYLGIADYDEESWGAMLYFDRLPHAAPDRAFDLVLAVLATDAPKAVKMQLNNKLMLALVNAQGGRFVVRIEAEAPSNPQLRWLLGGAYWWTSDSSVKARLAALADVTSWRADEDAHEEPDERIDFAMLPVAELARAWVTQKRKPRMDQDANYTALADCEYEMLEANPDKVIDLILEILKIETNPAVLSFLAAGPLEDVIGETTIDRIEREAAADPGFRMLLRGVWFNRQPSGVQSRLKALLQD
jgi:hypothetical protein